MEKDVPPWWMQVLTDDEKEELKRKDRPGENKNKSN